MSGSGGGNILDALDEDEDAEALLAASDSLQSEDAKKQLSAALKVSEVLRSQIAAYPLETQLPEPSDAERRHLDALRPVWAAAFGDRARKEPSEPAPEDLDEDSLSSAIDLGEVSIDGVEHIIRTLRHVGALPAGATRTLCDLRAGNGRLLAAAALLHPFASVAGLEPEAEKLEEAHAALARLQELAGMVGSERGALAGVVLEERDVLCLYIESDMMDKRVVSEAQLKNRIDAFFEGLESRRIRMGKAGAAGTASTAAV